MSAIHPQDQQRIDQLHGATSDDIEARLISLQDDSYELGRKRGIADAGEALKNLFSASQAAIEALRHAGSELHASHLESSLANARRALS